MKAYSVLFEHESTWDFTFNDPARVGINSSLECRGCHPFRLEDGSGSVRTDTEVIPHEPNVPS